MTFKRICLLLTVFGGINWGVIGIWSLDLVKFALSAVPAVVPFVYIALGLAALYTFFAYYIK